MQNGLLDNGCLTSLFYLRCIRSHRRDYHPDMSSAQDKGGDSRKEGQLKKWQETKFGVPKNGTWFFDVLSMLADAPEGAFPVAWDKPEKAKCFGYYESPTECYKALSNNVLKCCYEVFVRDSKYSEYSKRSPTLAYGDLEYYGDRDTDHVHARANLRRISTSVKRNWVSRPKCTSSAARGRF